MLSKDALKMITREAGKDVATILQKSEEASAAKAALRQSEADFDAKVGAMQARLKDAVTSGAESAAMAGGIGFGIGGAIAFIAHDKVSTYFGKGSWLALLTLPAAGLGTIAITPMLLKDRPKALGENAGMRAGGYGLGLGLLGVGGYFSYQDYMAA